jgi:outer membrane protein OmpA-like peptidoglycan-associated protein
MSTRLANLILCIVFLALTAPVIQAQETTTPKRKFDPPRIIEILRTKDKGTDGQNENLLYFVNKGQEVNINRGDVLNVYREKRIHPSLARTMRIFIGTLTITESQNGSSMGSFAPGAKINLPIIKYKVPMKKDLVVPRLIIDSGVLFNPGDAALNPGVAAEFQKVADFIQNFSPNKIIIEGHTDSDGDEDPNQLLSDQRSEAVVQYLVNTYPFITTGMIESRGYGETQPIAPNDSPENKKLNRRIEVVIWE